MALHFKTLQEKVTITNSFIAILAIIMISSCSKSNLSNLQNNESISPQMYLTSLGIELDSNHQTIHFQKIEDYRKYIALEAKDSVYKSLDALKFISLNRLSALVESGADKTIQQSSADVSKPWYKNENAIAISSIANTDGIFIIGDYAMKIDDEGQFIYVTNAGKLQNLKIYQSLKMLNAIDHEIFRYPTNFDILDMIEEIGIGNQTTQNSILCWGRSGADNSHLEPAVYFLDETWPASVISYSANNPYGDPSSNSRISVKLEYLKLGVYFTLALKGKYDREDGSIGPSGDNIFGGTPSWGTGESRWNIQYIEKHQGKCKKENEVFNSGTLAPPLNNENKTRRVFWESDNGLHKYQLSATLNLFLKRAWRGLETETYHYVEPNQFFSISEPRMVNSTEIFNFQVFEISSNY